MRTKLKSDFTKNVLTLMTGTTIAQAIPIAISPILTRIYTPEEYGVFALYTSIATIAAMAATGKYEMAIVLPKKDEDAINIFVLSTLISFFISLISFIIVYIFNEQITNFLGNKKVSLLLYLIPISVLLTGIYQSIRYWNNRKKYFKNLAINSVVQSGTGSSLNLGFGFFGFSSIGLVLGGILSQLVGVFFLGKLTWKMNSQIFSAKNNIKMLALLKKHKKLPMLTLPNALIDTFRMSGINILIAKYFTLESLGQYSIAWRMVVTPAGIIGNSLSQVFFQKLATAKKYELYSLTSKFITKAAIIALPIYLVVYFFAVNIFTFVFGENWELAGHIASILSPWLFLNFISSPISTIYIILNKQEVMFTISIFYMLTPLAIIFLMQENNIINVIEIISLSMSAILIFIIIYTLYLTSKFKRKHYDL